MILIPHRIVFLHIVVCGIMCAVSPIYAVHHPSLRETANVFVPRVQSLVLVNADTNQGIQTLRNNSVIEALSKFSVAALVDNGTLSVQFGYNSNPSFITESWPPLALCGNNAAGQFFPCTQLGIGRHTVTATPYSGLYAQGTRGPSYQVSFDIAGPCSVPKFPDSNWENFSPSYPLVIREGHGLMIGDDLVVFGGFTNNFANVTNHTYALNVMVSSSVWRRMDDLPLPGGLTHAAVALAGTKIYVCGGYSVYPAQHISDCFVYDHLKAPGRRQWTRITRLPKGGSAAAGMIYDSVSNCLFYAGGRQSFYNGTETTLDVTNTWKYSFQTLKWVASTPLPYSANHMSAVTHTNSKTGGVERHYFLGGQNLLNEAAGNVADVYEFIAANESWVKRASMPMARGHFPASTRSIGCGFLIGGGSVNSSTRYKNRTTDVSYYDITKNSWTSLGNLQVAEPTPIVTMHNGFLHFVFTQRECTRRRMEWT